MSDKKIYELHANICKALGNATRIEVIDALQNEEMTYGEIHKIIGGPKSSLAQHLIVLATKGILNQRREGLNVYYRITSVKVTKACQIMREVLIDNLKKQNQLLKNIG
ncbi:MAG: metalloregulator ArsR/SmtB family transcription factor [Bacteroidetes bacterium]|nr:metalloregulator ArsR/SmtB family transcription factor [Bacteroidota bacterium]MBU2585131.1 metalloregulator ArsR/SmtB family transcription factor [Bacteroidota bacterium]